MDEGRKRVLGIMAAILSIAAQKLASAPFDNTTFTSQVIHTKKSRF
jgi:hypothetical protein